jgi:hypothetical protein
MNDTPSALATVGILTRRRPEDPARRFGPPTRFFEECCSAARLLGLRIVVFDAADVHPEEAAMTPATALDGGWQECGWTSWPDVLYDRAPVIDPLYAPAADQVRARFIQADIPFINPVAMLRLAADKWASYGVLSRYAVPLPETGVLESGRLGDFLSRYEQVYIKPAEGSQGTGIIEAVRTGLETWLIRCGVERYEVHSIHEAERTVPVLIGNSAFRNGVYLVQRGISPESARSRTLPRFDLRVLMQKDERNAWRMTGVVARVGQTDVPTTNLSTGARSEEAESTLDLFFGTARRRTILDLTERAAFAICRGLERDIGPFGELGIDLIPDEAGRPWVIEINAKPGRSVFKRIAHSQEVSEPVRQRFQHIRQQSVTLPFLYATRLLNART